MPRASCTRRPGDTASRCRGRGTYSPDASRSTSPPSPGEEPRAHGRVPRPPSASEKIVFRRPGNVGSGPRLAGTKFCRGPRLRAKAAVTVLGHGSACRRLSIVRFAHDPERSVRHFLGGSPPGLRCPRDIDGLFGRRRFGVAGLPVLRPTLTPADAARLFPGPAGVPCRRNVALG